jgi:hypothetical protein
MAAETVSKSGDAKGARVLLDAVVRAFPEGHLASAAKALAATPRK